MQFEQYLIMSTKHHTKQDIAVSNALKQKIDMTKHLKENNTTYKAHWWRAMSITLFIHAWAP